VYFAYLSALIALNIAVYQWRRHWGWWRQPYTQTIDVVGMIILSVIGIGGAAAVGTVPAFIVGGVVPNTCIVAGQESLYDLYSKTGTKGDFLYINQTEDVFYIVKVDNHYEFRQNPARLSLIYEDTPENPVVFYFNVKPLPIKIGRVSIPIDGFWINPGWTCTHDFHVPVGSVTHNYKVGQ
jgi:hypothetical protein